MRWANELFSKCVLLDDGWLNPRNVFDHIQVMDCQIELQKYHSKD